MRILVIGAGDIGMPIIRYLSERGHLLTVIESKEENCKQVAEKADAAIFCGSGENREIWEKIEANNMDVMFALTNDDEINMKVCQIAKAQFGIPFIIARAHQPENVAKIRESGADVVICPAQETRRLFLNALERITTETLYEDTLANFKIAKVNVPLNGSIIGKTVKDLGSSQNCRILSVFRSGEVIYPEKDFIFKGGDKVLLSGSPEIVDKFIEKLRNVELT